MSTDVTAINPRTGEPVDSDTPCTGAAEVARLCELAVGAAAQFAALTRNERANLLERIADSIDRHRDQLIEIASQETGFTTAKLGGEATRAAYQFRFFAEVLREGSYLEVTIDPAGDTPMGPRPDLRRWLISIGPVAV